MSTTPERAPDPPTRPESGPGVTPVPPAGSTFASTRTRPDAPATPAPQAAPPSPAQVLEGLRARFELQGELGRGAFGIVWRARERGSRREVALKVLHADDALEPRRLERFRREGEVTAGLAHPGIVKVHGAGDVAGVPWLAYELVEGAETLTQAFWRLKADRAARVALVRQVAAALGHAHARGVVHRDVKPDNVLVDADGVARLADFGLAAAQGQARITRSGAMMGTPQYMSPEQFEGRRDDVGPASDVWGAGVMLYQALVAELPFRGATIMELGAAIRTATPRPPRALEPTVPAALEAICLKALARDPRDRYADGAALAADLEAFEAGRPVAAGSALSALRPRARRVARLGALALLPGVALGLGIVLALSGPSIVARDAGAPPSLSLEGPQDQQVVWEPSVRVRGALAGGTPPVRVSVALGGPAGRPRSLDLEQGAFETIVPLAPGEHVLVVTAQDAEGRTAEVRRTVRRGVGPSWYALLPPDRRPPYPLADGLDWGKVPNEFVNVRDGSVLVWVPPGTFRMGDEEQALGFENAWPAHDVVLTRGFFVGKTEVTWAQYRRYADATRTWFPAPVFETSDDHPVHSVSWNDARAYCAWAGLRLPTEAEWEYAARGPDARRYPWGGDPPTSRRANLQHDDVYPYTSPAGAFTQGASPFGCLDMVGNLWEWVEDRYGMYDGFVATDPTGPEAPSAPSQPGAPDLAEHRVNRGGAWNSTASYSTTARSNAEPFYRGTAIGFRVARSAR